MGRERYSPQEQQFYRLYLNSPAWRARRKSRIAKAGGRCEWTVDNFNGPPVRCARTRYLCVHHNTYERLGAEQDGDLDVYCWAHHMLEHLLWKRCVRCAQPCLENDGLAERWLTITLRAMGINLDAGQVAWRGLPTKEFLLDQIGSICFTCEEQLGPRVKE